MNTFAKATARKFGFTLAIA